MWEGAQELWSGLYKEMSAVAQTSVRPQLCSSAHCLSSLITALDYGARGPSWPIQISHWGSSWWIRLDTGGGPYSCPLSLAVPHPKTVLVPANPPGVCSQGLKYRKMTIASGHMIVAFLWNCCCQKSKLVLLHSYQKSNPGQRPHLHLSGITQAHITMVELCAGGKDFASCLRVFWHVH